MSMYITRISHQDSATPLDRASQYGSLHVVRLLLQRGAKMECRDEVRSYQSRGNCSMMCCTSPVHTAVHIRILWVFGKQCTCIYSTTQTVVCCHTLYAAVLGINGRHQPLGWTSGLKKRISVHPLEGLHHCQ